MSFFANPLADEEEVVPPDYPLEQYDELKREDDFNELLVRSTKLEGRQCRGDDASTNPELEACLRHTRQLRASLENSWLHMSELHVGATGGAHSSPTVETSSLSNSASLIGALDSAISQVHHHVAQRERLSQHLSALVEKEAAQLCSSASHLPAAPAQQGTGTPMLRALDALNLAWPPETVSSFHSPEVISERAAGAVRALEARLPSMSMEEAALASAAAQQLSYGLQSLSTLKQRCDALRVTVEVKSQEEADAHCAAEAFARWTAQRRLACSESAASPASSSVATAASFDIATAECLNKELSEENGRLEAVLARLVTQPLNRAQRDAFAGSALVQYVALTAYARELEEEVHRLGRAVLYLRGILAEPSASELWGERHGGSPAAASIQSTSHEGEERLARRLSRIHAVEKELRSGQAASGGAATVNDTVDTILSFGLNRLLEVHNVCLHAIALLSTYFEKQSGNAAFLSHALRGGGAVEDATVERVLDVQLPDAELVKQCCADMRGSSVDLAAMLKGIVDKSIVATIPHLTQWQAVRGLLTELLQSSMATTPDVHAEFSALLADYTEPKAPSATAASAVSAVTSQVHAHLEWATTVLSEEATAFADEKAAQLELIKAFWAAQQIEVNKKMAWLTKQPNAPLLMQLCDVERENEQLRRQLAFMQEASDEASALHNTLAELERRTSEEVQFNAAVRAELEELEAARCELEVQRDVLLSSMSSG
ncbi:conserved hypothetical protein [Leishmania mexicana MHOM/GT/2001/U1103]|uniref:Uncharacterized protein n=1 Tax=Leishmania mexicana (strain MHOM/GT/2001/U1103) TaxID=929439 RepID=E9ALG3_LEIMU|nr:conserved hypothetical protein [Leishmania mexicana MHOM/GT/2001/U1103]CBZ23767.1 conserved hypothetical protein [Leishmania mexicana MHOM/GT/2001/U1103]